MAAAFAAERELRERNEAMRRAFAAVPGGPENLATIEGLVAASERVADASLSAADERLLDAALAQDEAAAAAGPRSILSELVGRTPGEADALIRERAATIERGLEAHDLFLEERRQRAQTQLVRDALRRVPGGGALITTLENGRGPAPDSGGFAASDDEALAAERTLTKRNDGMRRAFAILEDGDTTLTAVELLTTNGDGRPRDRRLLSPEVEERLIEAELAVEEPAGAAGAPSIFREVQQMLAEQDVAEQEALIQEIASKIPMGTQAVDSFRQEQRLQEERLRNRPPPRFLSPDEEERLFEDALANDEAAAGGGVSEYRLQQQEARLFDAALEGDERASRGGVSEHRRQQQEEQLTAAVLAEEEAAANPATGVRFDLLDQLEEMFAAVTSQPFETSPITMRAFSDSGLNGLSAEGRFRVIGDSLGFSQSQLDRLLAGATLDEIGRPSARFISDVGLGPAGRAGAFAALQRRDDLLSVDVLELIDRPRGAVVNTLSPEGSGLSIITDPGATAGRFKEGFLESSDVNAGDAIGFRSLADRDLVGSISLRDLGGSRGTSHSTRRTTSVASDSLMTSLAPACGVLTTPHGSWCQASVKRGDPALARQTISREGSDGCSGGRTIRSHRES